MDPSLSQSYCFIFSTCGVTKTWNRIAETTGIISKTLRTDNSSVYVKLFNVITQVSLFSREWYHNDSLARRKETDDGRKFLAASPTICNVYVCSFPVLLLLLLIISRRYPLSDFSSTHPAQTEKRKKKNSNSISLDQAGFFRVILHLCAENEQHTMRIVWFCYVRTFNFVVFFFFFKNWLRFGIKTPFVRAR